MNQEVWMSLIKAYLNVLYSLSLVIIYLAFKTQRGKTTNLKYKNINFITIGVRVRLLPLYK